MYNGLEMEVCDVTKPVHFQWAAGIPYLAIRITRYKPVPTLIKDSRSEVTLPIDHLHASENILITFLIAVTL